MADRISCGWDFLARVFQEILGIVCHEDGVSFDAGSIKIEPITVEKKYFGTRFYFTAHMDTIAYNMSVDIGFGDVVIPHSTTIDFPLLLSDIPSVNIQAYSLETVIAEKFHTMIDRDVLNSRMTPSKRRSTIEDLHTTPICNCLRIVLLQTGHA